MKKVGGATPRASSAKGRDMVRQRSNLGAKPQGRIELLDWINRVGQASYSTVPDLKDGLLYCQLVYCLALRTCRYFESQDQGAAKQGAGTVSARQAERKEWTERRSRGKLLLAGLRWGAAKEEDCQRNGDLLKEMLRQCVPKQWTVDVDERRLMEGKLQDNMVFLQWLHGYYTKLTERFPVPNNSSEDVTTVGVDALGAAGLLMKQREAIQRENSTVLMKPELLWTRLPSVATAAALSTAKTPTRYDPTKYLDRDVSSQGPTRLRPTLPPPAEGAAANGEDRALQYLSPLIEHVERCESVAEQRALDFTARTADAAARMDQLASERDDLLRVLREVALIVSSELSLSEEHSSGDSDADRALWNNFLAVFRSHENVFGMGSQNAPARPFR